VRELANRERIEAFVAALAREATSETEVFLVGGTSAVLIGWRDTTMDVDLVMRPESNAMLRAIPAAIDPPSFCGAVDMVFPW
jgi:hypothetical protein